jgi:lipoprotein signal peptidase
MEETTSPETTPPVEPDPTGARRRRWIDRLAGMPLELTACLVAIDQTLKLVAVRRTHASAPDPGEVLALAPRRIPSGWWTDPAAQPAVAVVLAVAGVGLGLAAQRVVPPEKSVGRVGASLVLAGTVGRLADVLLGATGTAFVHVDLGPLGRWSGGPADLFLGLGVVLLARALLWHRFRNASPSP